MRCSLAASKRWSAAGAGVDQGFLREVIASRGAMLQGASLWILKWQSLLIQGPPKAHKIGTPAQRECDRVRTERGAG